MTIKQFDKTKFFARMPVIYDKEKRLIGSVDFHEKLIGLIECDGEPYHWVRCENISIDAIDLAIFESKEYIKERANCIDTSLNIKLTLLEMDIDYNLFDMQRKLFSNRFKIGTAIISSPFFKYTTLDDFLKDLN